MRPPSAASTGARSQQHSSTITGGYVQQVPYPKDDAQTWHSQLGEYFILATRLYTYTLYIELYLIHYLFINRACPTTFIPPLPRKLQPASYWSYSSTNIPSTITLWLPSTRTPIPTSACSPLWTPTT